MHCVDLQDISEKYFMVCFVKELFESVDDHSIIDFIKQTSFLSSIAIIIIFVLYQLHGPGGGFTFSFFNLLISVFILLKPSMALNRL